jgi:choline dehydrogenase
MGIQSAQIRSHSVRDGMQYNTIIVGAGSAGAILAARLTEDPSRTVLLIEAGPDYPDFDKMPEPIKYGYGYDRNIWATAFGPNSVHSWNYTGRSTDEGEPILIPRGKVVGGSSAVNAQIFLRGLPEDFDDWAARGNDRWSSQELLSYHRKLETDQDFSDDFHGDDGPIIARRWKRSDMTADQEAFYQACLSAGYMDSPDQNHPDSTGVGPTPFNNPEGIRWSTALGYLNPARHRLNLTIRPNVHTRRVLIEGGRAVGVEVESGGEVFTLNGDEIILSAGAINSPQLLMLSGIGPADHLRDMGVAVVKDLPGVGKNLRDHPQVQLTWKTVDDFEQDPLAPRIQLALRYTAENSPLRNDMFIHPFSYATESGIYLFSDEKPLGVGMIIALYLAKGAGEITLNSTDPYEQPFLNYNYLEEEEDRRRFREAIRICLRLAQSDAYREFIERTVEPTEAALESDETLDQWLLKSVRTSHHVSGTAKMGPASDDMAVVDQFGHVYGIDNLRVTDASIMPDCIRANTNVTAMVIGERIADFIKAGE